MRANVNYLNFNEKKHFFNSHISNLLFILTIIIIIFIYKWVCLFVSFNVPVGDCEFHCLIVIYYALVYVFLSSLELLLSLEFN